MKPEQMDPLFEEMVNSEEKKTNQNSLRSKKTNRQSSLDKSCSCSIRLKPKRCLPDRRASSRWTTTTLLNIINKILNAGQKVKLTEQRIEETNQILDKIKHLIRQLDGKIDTLSRYVTDDLETRPVEESKTLRNGSTEPLEKNVSLKQSKMLDCATYSDVQSRKNPSLSCSMFNTGESFMGPHVREFSCISENSFSSEQRSVHMNSRRGHTFLQRTDLTEFHYEKKAGGVRPITDFVTISKKTEGGHARAMMDDDSLQQETHVKILEYEPSLPLHLLEDSEEADNIDDLKPHPKPNLVEETEAKSSIIFQGIYNDNLAETFSSGYPINTASELTTDGCLELSSEHIPNGKEDCSRRTNRTKDGNTCSFENLYCSSKFWGQHYLSNKEENTGDLDCQENFIESKASQSNLDKETSVDTKVEKFSDMFTKEDSSVEMENVEYSEEVEKGGSERSSRSIHLDIYNDELVETAIFNKIKTAVDTDRNKYDTQVEDKDTAYGTAVVEEKPHQGTNESGVFRVAADNSAEDPNNRIENAEQDDVKKSTGNENFIESKASQSILEKEARVYIKVEKFSDMLTKEGSSVAMENVEYSEKVEKGGPEGSSRSIHLDIYNDELVPTAIVNKIIAAVDTDTNKYDNQVEEKDTACGTAVVEEKTHQGTNESGVFSVAADNSAEDPVNDEQDDVKKSTVNENFTESKASQSILEKGTSVNQGTNESGVFSVAADNSAEDPVNRIENDEQDDVKKSTVNDAKHKLTYQYENSESGFFSATPKIVLENETTRCDIKNYRVDDSVRQALQSEITDLEENVSLSTKHPCTATETKKWTMKQDKKFFGYFELTLTPHQTLIIHNVTLMVIDPSAQDDTLGRDAIADEPFNDQNAKSSKNIHEVIPAFATIEVKKTRCKNRECTDILRTADGLTDSEDNNFACDSDGRTDKKQLFSPSVCEISANADVQRGLAAVAIPEEKHAIADSNTPYIEVEVPLSRTVLVMEPEPEEDHCGAHRNSIIPSLSQGRKKQRRKKKKKFTKKAVRRKRFPTGETCSSSKVQSSTDTSSDFSSVYTKPRTRRRNKRSTNHSSCSGSSKMSKKEILYDSNRDSGIGTSVLLNDTRDTAQERSETLFIKGPFEQCLETLQHALYFELLRDISSSCKKKKILTAMTQSKIGFKSIKVVKKSKLSPVSYRKELRNFFEKRSRMKFSVNRDRMTVKDLVRELYIPHQTLSVFGLGTYFDRLNRGESLTLRERMQYEWLRLASFQHYRGASNAIALARNGLYHDPADGPTSARCYLCDFRLSEWQDSQNVEEQHRRQSPNCPFHANRNEESVNVAITYDDASQSSRTPLTSRAAQNSTISSTAISAGPGISTTAPSTVQSSLSGIGNLFTRSATGSPSTLASSVREAARSLTQGQASAENVSRTKEVTPQQPVDNDENRDRSLLALPDTRMYRVLGRSGETAYSHLTTPPRRNNVAIGAETNAGLDAVANSVQTSTATCLATNTTSTTVASSIYQPNSIFGAPIGAGNNPPTSLISTTSTNTVSSVSSSLSKPPPAVAAVSSLLRPTDPPIGGGGRTDPTITVVVDNPKHPDYREIDARITSFQGWPDYLDQTPRQMAEAGFFFVGVADFTRCFCCGGGLRNWEPGDDPMLEHTRWFPRCEYVNKLKGERYVAAVQRRHQEHMAEQQRQQLELAQRRDASREAPDPMTTEAAAVLREMGYQAERIRDAILTVRRQIGVSDVTTQQVLAYILDQSEGRSPPPAATRQSPTQDLGVKIQELNLTTAIGTNPGSAVINTTSTISTVTSTVGAGSSSSASLTSASTTRSEGQQSGSSTSSSSSGKASEGARNKHSGSNGKEGKGSSNAEKQSAASGGESDEKYKSAEESLTSETKSSKKKTKKKTKSKAGSKSSSTEGASVDVRTLKEENEKLKEMQTCKICMDRPVNTTILPCGHLVCCDRCASRLNRCPICMKRIKGTVKTFMS